MAGDRQLLERLAPYRAAKVVILGIGNPLKGDDAVGSLVCARLSGRVPATVIDAGGVPENYIGPVLRAAPEVLLVVDAVDCGGPPGQIRVCTPDEIEPHAFSTHALSLHLALDLIRREKRLEVYVIGIQAGAMRLGDGLSAPVREAAETLADALIRFFRPDGWRDG
jgi:hydrogenase 3 maturation protease